MQENEIRENLNLLAYKIHFIVEIDFVIIIFTVMQWIRLKKIDFFDIKSMFYYIL